MIKHLLHNLTRTAAIAGCCTALVMLASCKSTKPNDPNKYFGEVHADAVTAIDAHQAISVKYKQAEGAPHITVTCKKTYASQLNIHMEGTTLVAAYKPNARIADAGVEVVLTSPSLSEITATNAAAINLGDEVMLNGDLKITCNTAGSVKCKKVSCKNLTIDASTASLVQLSKIACSTIDAKAATSSLILLDGKVTTATLLEGTSGEIRCPELTIQHGTRTPFEESFPDVSPVKKKTPAPTQQPANDSTKTTPQTAQQQQNKS